MISYYQLEKIEKKQECHQIATNYIYPVILVNKFVEDSLNILKVITIISCVTKKKNDMLKGNVSTLIANR